MDNKVKKETIRTEITGQIQGVDVNINYERKAGCKPEVLYANAQLVDNTSGSPVQAGQVSMNYAASGNKNVNVSGTASMLQVQALTVELEAELIAEYSAVKGI